MRPCESGPPWAVEYHTDARGRAPAREFIEGLSAKDRAAVARAIGLPQRYGPGLSMPYARHLEGKLWELRSGARRLLYFLYTGRRFIILHGYRKQGRRTPRREIATAKRRMAEYL